MKKVLFSLLLFFVLLIPLYATELGHNSDGYDRNESNNYGVKKRWKINDNNINIIKNTPYVDANNKIYDFADVLSESDESELKSLIDGFINETGLDFVFVSIDMPYTNDSENEDYSSNFYDYNDYGLNNENYGGIIFVRNNYESDRYYTATIFGEAQLYCDTNDLDIILDDIYSYISSGNIKEGVSFFIHQFKNKYDLGYEEDEKYIDENGTLVVNKKYSLPYFTSILSGGLISLLTMLGLVKKNKMVTKANNANDYLIKSSVEYINKSDKMISTITTHHHISSGSSMGGGSHSGFGSSGGGHISGGRHG